MNFDSLKELYNLGEFQNILDFCSQIDLSSKNQSLSKTDRSIYLSFETRSLIRLGRIQEVETLLDKSQLHDNLTISDLINESSLVNLEITRGNSPNSLSRFEKLEHLDFLLSKFQAEEPKIVEFWGSYYLYLIGVAYYYELKYDYAIKSFEKSLELNKYNEFIKGKSYYYLGFIHLEQNNETKFDYYLDLSFDIFKKINAKQGLGWIYLWRGNRQIQKGNYDQALDCLNHAEELFRLIGGIQELNVVKSLTGLVNFHKGKIEEAEDLLNQSFSESIKLGNPMLSSYILLPFVLVNIHLGNKYIIEKNLKLFEVINKDSRVKFHLDLCKALFLKSSTKLIDKAKAEELFIELLHKSKTESDNFFITGDKSIRFFLLINLAEIYYMEFLISNDIVVLQEIQKLFDDFNQFTTNVKKTELIEISLIKAKLLVVEGRIPESFKELEFAKELALENDYITLNEKIEDELNMIKNQIEKWGSKSSIIERITAIDMQLYMKEAIKITKD